MLGGWEEAWSKLAHTHTHTHTRKRWIARARCVQDPFLTHSMRWVPHRVYTAHIHGGSWHETYHQALAPHETQLYSHYHCGYRNLPTMGRDSSTTVQYAHAKQPSCTLMALGTSGAFVKPSLFLRARWVSCQGSQSTLSIQRCSVLRFCSGDRQLSGVGHTGAFCRSWQ